MRLVFGFLVAMAAALGTARADPLRVYAAGSLTAAFNDMVREFPAGAIAPPVYGPSGVLREKIQQGAPVDVFASADMDQPRMLARNRNDRMVIMFTRNQLCAQGRDRLGITTENLLEKLLDPAVRLATSTPHADPAGDYTWAVFARADAVRPGAKAVLEAKAMQLVGGPATPPPAPGHQAVADIFLTDRADVFIGYCSGVASVARDVPGLAGVALPAALTVGPAYGLIVLSDHPMARDFALFVLSEHGQEILFRHGFDPVGRAR